MTTATLTIPPSAPGDSAFEFVRKLVHERSAIALEATKEYLVESRLLPVARQHGLASLNDLVATIRKVVRDLDPTIPIRELAPMNSSIGMSFFPARVATIALGL